MHLIYGKLYKIRRVTKEVENMKNEEAARKLFIECRGNSYFMAKNGVLEQYRAFNISKDKELGWIKELSQDIYSRKDMNVEEIIVWMNELLGLVVDYPQIVKLSQVILWVNERLDFADHDSWRNIEVSYIFISNMSNIKQQFDLVNLGEIKQFFNQMLDKFNMYCEKWKIESRQTDKQMLFRLLFSTAKISYLERKLQKANVPELSSIQTIDWLAAVKNQQELSKAQKLMKLRDIIKEDDSYSEVYMYNLVLQVSDISKEYHDYGIVMWCVEMLNTVFETVPLLTSHVNITDLSCELWDKALKLCPRIQKDNPNTLHVSTILLNEQIQYIREIMRLAGYLQLYKRSELQEYFLRLYYFLQDEVDVDYAPSDDNLDVWVLKEELFDSVSDDDREEYIVAVRDLFILFGYLLRV